MVQMVAEAGGGGSGGFRWKRRWEVSASSPLQHCAYFHPVQSIHFMLAVFEKLYKYAELPDDKIPIKICKIWQSIESTWDEDKSWWLS